MENKPAVARCMADVDYKGAASREWEEWRGFEEAEQFCILIVVEAEGQYTPQKLQNCTPQRADFTITKLQTVHLPLPTMNNQSQPAINNN